MSSYQPRICLMPPDKVAPFRAIAQRAVERAGSVRGAADALGVSRTVMYGLLDDNYLTDKQARQILAAHKLSKTTK